MHHQEANLCHRKDINQSFLDHEGGEWKKVGNEFTLAFATIPNMAAPPL